MLHCRYSHTPHSQVGAGLGGGSWAKVEVIAAAAKNATKNQNAKDKKCIRFFIVMYYITIQRKLFALLAISILLARLEGIECAS
jgi:hypothetical protein